MRYDGVYRQFFFSKMVVVVVIGTIIFAGLMMVRSMFMPGAAVFDCWTFILVLPVTVIATGSIYWFFFKRRCV